MGTDETKEKQDVKTSVPPKGTSAPTYTEEQVAERERKARSDALSDLNRYKVESEKALKAAQAAEGRLNQMLKQQEEAELEAHRDDEPELRRIRAERARKKADDDLAMVTQELTEHKERLTKYETDSKELSLSQTIREIATRIGVDPEKLSKHAKATDGSSEAIEEIAKDLPKLTPPKPGLRPDSNRSLGGNLTWEAVRAAYIKDPYDPVTKERYLEMKAQRS